MLAARQGSLCRSTAIGLAVFCSTLSMPSKHSSNGISIYHRASEGNEASCVDRVPGNANIGAVGPMNDPGSDPNDPRGAAKHHPHKSVTNACGAAPAAAQRMVWTHFLHACDRLCHWPSW